MATEICSNVSNLEFLSDGEVIYAMWIVYTSPCVLNYMVSQRHGLPLLFCYIYIR